MPELCQKKSRFGLSAWAQVPSTRKRNSKNILNQDLPIFKTVADHRIDRNSFVGHDMKLLTAIALVFVSMATAYAEQQDNLVTVISLGSEWSEILIPKEFTRDRWTVRMFRNAENGDLLTLARLESDGPRSFDDAWEFAPTGYPYWFPQNKHYTINTIKAEWLDNKPENERKKVAYTVVNEHDSGNREDTLMANGFVVNMDGFAYYVQHTSKSPIPDWPARDVLRRLERGLQR